MFFLILFFTVYFCMICLGRNDDHTQHILQTNTELQNKLWKELSSQKSNQEIFDLEEGFIAQSITEDFPRASATKGKPKQEVIENKDEINEIHDDLNNRWKSKKNKIINIEDYNDMSESSKENNSDSDIMKHEKYRAQRMFDNWTNKIRVADGINEPQKDLNGSMEFRPETNPQNGMTLEGYQPTDVNDSNSVTETLDNIKYTRQEGAKAVDSNEAQSTSVSQNNIHNTEEEIEKASDSAEEISEGENPNIIQKNGEEKANSTGETQINRKNTLEEGAQADYNEEKLTGASQTNIQYIGLDRENAEDTNKAKSIPISQNNIQFTGGKGAQAEESNEANPTGENKNDRKYKEKGSESKNNIQYIGKESKNSENIKEVEVPGVSQINEQYVGEDSAKAAMSKEANSLDTSPNNKQYSGESKAWTEESNKGSQLAHSIDEKSTGVFQNNIQYIGGKMELPEDSNKPKDASQKNIQYIGEDGPQGPYNNETKSAGTSQNNIQYTGKEGAQVVKSNEEKSSQNNIQYTEEARALVANNNEANSTGASQNNKEYTNDEGEPAVNGKEIKFIGMPQHNIQNQGKEGVHAENNNVANSRSQTQSKSQDNRRGRERSADIENKAPDMDNMNLRNEKQEMHNRPGNNVGSWNTRSQKQIGVGRNFSGLMNNEIHGYDESNYDYFETKSEREEFIKLLKGKGNASESRQGNEQINSELEIDQDKNVDEKLKKDFVSQMVFLKSGYNQGDHSTSKEQKVDHHRENLDSNEEEIFEEARELRKESKSKSSKLLNFQSIPESYNLIGIRSLISPSLLYALASSGWEDDIAIVDSTFSTDTIGNVTFNTEKVIRLDGIPIIPLVREIMKLWQLDFKNPMAVMVNEDNKISITTSALVHFVVEAEQKLGHAMESKDSELLKMKDFKRRASHSKHIIITGEPGPWNSIIIRKGLITSTGCKHHE